VSVTLDAGSFSFTSLASVDALHSITLAAAELPDGTFLTKSLSENPRGTQSCNGELKMQKAQVILGFLFPTDQQAARAIGPRVSSLYDPTAGAAAPPLRNRGALTLFGDVNDISSPMCRATHRFCIVTFIRAKMLFFARPRLWTPHRNTLKRFGDQFLIMHVGAGDGDPDGHSSAVCQHGPFDAQLATIGRVFPGFFFHPVAPWSSPRPNSAIPSRFPSIRRTLPEHVAITFGTLHVEPTLESRNGWRCLTRIARALPSTDNQSAAHTKFQSRRFAKADAGARLCNFVCKLGAAA